MSKKPLFWVPRPGRYDKTLVILGPERLTLDYDDVDQAAQRRYAAKIARILNAHWNDEEPPASPPSP